MSKPELIKKHMLEESLRKEFDEKIEKEKVRLNTDPIKLDDLDNNLRVKLTNIAPGSNAYDDKELRNRIIALESDAIKGADVFKLAQDKVSRKLLDSDLNAVCNETTKIKTLEANKADKSYLDSNFRKLADPILENDFEAKFQKKINDFISDMNRMDVELKNVKPIVIGVGNMQSDIAALQTKKADSTDLATNYRRNDKLICIADVDSSISTDLKKVSSLEASLLTKAENADLEKNYRKVSVPISMGDFESNLQATLNKSIIATQGNEALCKSVFDEKFGTEGHKWCYDAFGTTQVGMTADGTDTDYLHFINPYKFALGVTTLAGTVGNSGAMTHTAALNYLYSRVETDTAKISTLESGINNSSSSSANMEKRINKKIDDLTTSLKDTEKEVADLKNKNNILETDITNIKADITDLKKKNKDLEAEIAALKKQTPAT